MTLLRINATEHGLALHNSTAPLLPCLRQHLLRQPPTMPVVIMTHGFRFAPGAGADCPHNHILSVNKQPIHPKALSWPCALGLTTDDTAPGLGIAFGWSALGSLWQAHAQAKQAGMMLAALITQIHALTPQRPIHLMGHSLGARVILTALPHAPTGSVHRLLLLAPAEYQSTTRAALTSPAGRQAEAFMITSGENALFDVALERLIASPCPKDRVIGLSAPDLPNLTTLRLDCPATLAALAKCDLRIAPRQKGICHWSVYLRPGVFDLYRALLWHPQHPTLAALRLPVKSHSPAFRPRVPAFQPLSLFRKAPS